jgi:pimeloyl-ACP methyl ester carboxylesterase
MRTDIELTELEAPSPSRIVVFSVGAGGNPERHLPLLTALRDDGATVVAPRFERLASPTPSEHDLLLRSAGLRFALDRVARPGLPVVGIGHSIGATMLLALAGGRVWMRGGVPLEIDPHERLDRLVLFAPATGFFQAPHALDAIRTPIFVWVGTEDAITPPSQAAFLKNELEGKAPIDLRIIGGAGHFSFMNVPPPLTTEPLANRDAFLAELTGEVRSIVSRP